LTVLIFNPALPLLAVIAILGSASVSIGSVYPVATVSIQNAVPPHQVGVAMGAMNFFRALVSAFVVAIMGAIVLAGLGVTPQRGTGTAVVNASAGLATEHVAHVFGFLFLAAAVCLALALAALGLMQEHPLRGTVRPFEPVETAPGSAPQSLLRDVWPEPAGGGGAVPASAQRAPHQS
jgi:MFS family permease